MATPPPTRSHRRTWAGIALLLLGGALLLDSTGAIDLGDLIEVLWPLLLVLWGVKLVRDGRRPWDRSATSGPGGSQAQGPAHPSRSRSRARRRRSRHEPHVTTADDIHVSRVLGAVDTRVQSSAFTGGSVSTTFGDLEIDLSTVTLAEGEHVLHLSGVFGNTGMTLPAGLAVSVSARTTLGNVEVAGQRREGLSPSIHFESPGYDSASRRLRIVVSQVVGNVVIR